MCSRVEIVLWIVKKKKIIVVFIELKKKKIHVSLFSIFVHKLYYFISVIFFTVGIITVAYEKFSTTEKKVKYAFFE